MLTLLGDLQVPLLAAMLLGGCLGKAIKSLRTRSMAAGLGPTALFPLRLRAPAAIAMCVTELGLGIGLIVTCSEFGRGDPALLIRIGIGLLFLVATLALIELRSVRPDVGCGCFGEFSQTPVTGRAIARSALLCISALSIAKHRPITLPIPTSHLAVVLPLFAAELVVIALLSPEVQDLLVRIGYSAPCELRVVSPEHSLTALHRSAQWRKHAALITDQRPSDIWRELCWRYITYPSQFEGKDAELVFAIRLETRRPAVLSALVDAATGQVLPWPAGAAKPARVRIRVRARRPSIARPTAVVRADLRADPVARVEAASLPGVRSAGRSGARSGLRPGARHSNSHRRFPPA